MNAKDLKVGDKVKWYDDSIRIITAIEIGFQAVYFYGNDGIENYNWNLGRYSSDYKFEIVK